MTGCVLLLLNILVFFTTWLRWYIGIPAAILMIVAMVIAGKTMLADKEIFQVRRSVFVLLMAVAVAWVLLSGIGGLAAQKGDMHWRNAIFRDLINFAWPVRYPGASDSSLSYYFAFWLIPAITGKAAAYFFNEQAGWVAANITTALYACAVLFIVIILLAARFRAGSLKKALPLLAILLFFSGMDIIPLITAVDIDIIIARAHIEWWNHYQYSSNATQLAWVFNQALPAWLAVSLYLHEKKIRHYALLGGLLLPYGPLPFVGLFWLMATSALTGLRAAVRDSGMKEFVGNVFSVPNLLTAGVIFPIFGLFYFSNSAASGGGLGGNSWDMLYVPFIVFEFLLYIILIWRNTFGKIGFMPVVIGLTVIPFITLGNAQDFCMRASIPLLFMLMVFILEYLLNDTKNPKRKTKMPGFRMTLLLICLAFGSVTAFVEFGATVHRTFVNVRDGEPMYADSFGSLNNEDMNRDNFVTEHTSDTLFYCYLAKQSDQT